MRNNYKENRAIIQRQLGLSDLEYCELQMNTGSRYLDVFCLGPESKKAMEYSRAFWQWWINQWNLYDDMAIKAQKSEYRHAQEYADFHFYYLMSADGKLVEIYPPAELVRLAKKEVANAI